MSTSEEISELILDFLKTIQKRKPVTLVVFALIHPCVLWEQKKQEMLFLDSTCCEYSEVDHINAQRCPRHGDECSLFLQWVG